MIFGILHCRPSLWRINYFSLFFFSFFLNFCSYLFDINYILFTALWHLSSPHPPPSLASNILPYYVTLCAYVFNILCTWVWHSIGIFLKRFICLVEVRYYKVNWNSNNKMFLHVKSSSPTRWLKMFLHVKSSSPIRWLLWDWFVMTQYCSRWITARWCKNINFYCRSLN